MKTTYLKFGMLLLLSGFFFSLMACLRPDECPSEVFHDEIFGNYIKLNYAEHPDRNTLMPTEAWLAEKDTAFDPQILFGPREFTNFEVILPIAPDLPENTFFLTRNGTENFIHVSFDSEVYNHGEDCGWQFRISNFQILHSSYDSLVITETLEANNGFHIDVY